MEATCNNFKGLYKEIEKVIKTASFVAIDIEFLGLDNGESDQKCSLFDTPEERFSKQRHSVINFPPVQLGLAFFSSIDDGQKYKCDVYNIYLFKQGVQFQEFAFSVSSMSFLENHGFNFNTFVANGVSHLNLDELKDTIHNFRTTSDGIRSFGDKMPALLANLQQTLNHRIARLRRKSTGSEGAQSRSFDPFSIDVGREKLSDLQKSAILYRLYSTIPGVRMKFNNDMLVCDSNRLTKRELATIKEGLLKTVHRELMGASEVFLSIIEHKLPVVGHNALYDLMYIYHYFIADLPEDYAKFKTSLTNIFDCIIDTKHLAEECVHKLSWFGVVSYRLEALGKFFKSKNSENCAPRLPIDMTYPLNSRRKKVMRRGLQSYHDASFDAFTTGHIFLRLSHLISRPVSFTGSGPILPFETIFEHAKMFEFRIPVPLLKIPYVNLVGEDPPSRAPPEIRLRILGSGSLEQLKGQLRSLFGRWRCDVRLEEDIVRIATNTDTTCRRVFNFLLSQEFYDVMDSQSSPSNSYSSPYRSPSPSFPKHCDSSSYPTSTTDSLASFSSVYNWASYLGSLLLTAHVNSQSNTVH